METETEILLRWNPNIHADLQETLKMWEIVHELKEYGNGELTVIIRDGVIVSAKTQKNWVRKGGDFTTCTI